jgi:hypothetical protein
LALESFRASLNVFGDLRGEGLFQKHALASGFDFLLSAGDSDADGIGQQLNDASFQRANAAAAIVAAAVAHAVKRGDDGA